MVLLGLAGAGGSDPLSSLTLYWPLSYLWVHLWLTGGEGESLSVTHGWIGLDVDVAEQGLLSGCGPTTI